MSIILPVEDKHPQFGNNCFIAPNATIVGDVIMGNEGSVWFNAVVRGDVNSVRMGNKVNIQDGAVIHCTRNPASPGPATSAIDSVRDSLLFPSRTCSRFTKEGR